MLDHKFAFIGGLHRSGTTILFRCLGEHPQVSRFRDTGVFRDEGQHLQTVYPIDSAIGGAGRMGYRSTGHLTESSLLVTEANKQRLMAEWSQHWDLAKPLLLEKTPANLVRTRFLQGLFPNSYFIVVARHPVAVALATRKWLRWPKPSTHFLSPHFLLERWVTAHELFETDRAHVGNVLFLRYEDFVANPCLHLEKVCAFLGIDSFSPTTVVERNTNGKYFEVWTGWRRSLLGRSYTGRLIDQFEDRVNRWGYSLVDLER